MTKVFAAEYIEYVTDQPFEAVIQAFESATGSIEGGAYRKAMIDAGNREEFETKVRALEGNSGFMRFMTVDHGAWMKKFEGADARSRMYVLGNPLIARTMLRHDMATGLNVPVRLQIFEDSEKKTRLGYHQPSSLMAVYGNAEVMKACEVLDQKLAKLAMMLMGNSEEKQIP